MTPNLQKGDRVSWTAWHKVGGKYDHHSWNPVNHAGVILNIAGDYALVKCDDGRERTADIERCTRVSNLKSQISNPQEPPC